MCISRRGWVTCWMSLCGPSAVSVLCKQRHFLLQAPSVSVRRSAADAQDCVEMLQPPKDVMLGLYSFKINSSSLNYFLPVVVWDILLSKRRFICSINTQSARCYDTQFTSGNVWVQILQQIPKSCLLLLKQKFIQIYYLSFSSYDNWICFAHLFLCFTCGWLCFPDVVGETQSL